MGDDQRHSTQCRGLRLPRPGRPAATTRASKSVRLSPPGGRRCSLRPKRATAPRPAGLDLLAGCSPTNRRRRIPGGPVSTQWGRRDRGPRTSSSAVRRARTRSELTTSLERRLVPQAGRRAAGLSLPLRPRAGGSAQPCHRPSCIPYGLGVTEEQQPGHGAHPSVRGLSRPQGVGQQAVGSLRRVLAMTLATNGASDQAAPQRGPTRRRRSTSCCSRRPGWRPAPPANSCPAGRSGRCSTPSGHRYGGPVCRGTRELARLGQRRAGPA